MILVSALACACSDGGPTDGGPPGSDSGAPLDAPALDAGTGVAASSGLGAVSFAAPDPAVFPCSVDVDASLTFPSVEAWVPAEEILRVAGLPVVGCF